MIDMRQLFIKFYHLCSNDKSGLGFLDLSLSVTNTDVIGFQVRDTCSTFLWFFFCLRRIRGTSSAVAVSDVIAQRRHTEVHRLSSFVEYPEFVENRKYII